MHIAGNGGVLETICKIELPSTLNIMEYYETPEFWQEINDCIDNKKIPVMECEIVIKKFEEQF